MSLLIQMPLLQGTQAGHVFRKALLWGRYKNQATALPTSADSQMPATQNNPHVMVTVSDPDGPRPNFMDSFILKLERNKKKK